MPLRTWRSPPPRTPFAPNWTVPLFIEELSDPAVNREIRSVVLAKEQRLRDEIEPIPISGIEDGLTSRWHGFNIFTWQEPCMRRFQKFVKKAYAKLLEETHAPRTRCYIQGWANVVREGEKLSPHSHDQSPFSYLSGNFCVTSQDSATIYYPPYVYSGSLDPKTSIAIKNRPGMLTIFPSGIFHETSIHKGDRERITLAFDIFLEDVDPRGRAGREGKHILFDDPQAPVGGSPLLM